MSGARHPSRFNTERDIPLPVNNVASLHAAMLDGCIYANVRTLMNPGGGIRGQVRQ
jgi:hypothetical protein